MQLLAKQSAVSWWHRNDAGHHRCALIRCICTRTPQGRHVEILDTFFRGAFKWQSLPTYQTSFRIWHDRFPGVRERVAGHLRAVTGASPSLASRLPSCRQALVKKTLVLRVIAQRTLLLITRLDVQQTAGCHFTRIAPQQSLAADIRQIKMGLCGKAYPHGRLPRARTRCPSRTGWRGRAWPAPRDYFISAFFLGVRIKTLAGVSKMLWHIYCVHKDRKC